MGELIVNGKIDLVSTTNFDDLVQAGVHSINPGFSIKTYHLRLAIVSDLR